MDLHFDPLNTTFMNLQSHNHSTTTTPQRCLVALIDVNRLKVNLSQLRQAVTKEIQRMRGVMTMASESYQQMVKELKRSLDESKNSAFNQKRAQQILKQKDEIIMNLTIKIQQMQVQKQRVMKLLKKQTQTINNLKSDQDQEVQKLNLRVNELYSIIHQKTSIIQAMELEDNMNKKTIKNMKTERSRKPGVITDLSNKQDSITSRVESKTDVYHTRTKSVNDDKKTSREQRQTPSAHNKTISGIPLQEMNITMDPIIMTRISDLITSITHKNYPCKQFNHENLSNDVIKNQQQQYKEHKITFKQQNKKFQKKKQDKLQNLFKNAIKGYSKNQKIFK